MPGEKLRFGAFIPPFHELEENPTLALERDLELAAWLDRLDYDEAWFGEHHSAGLEIIGSPEVFIAAAAARTQRIRLGTGVVSLPYHHPLMLAERINLLDHITRGRAMFGMGPGSLPPDAEMMGIEVAKQRDMLDEAMAAVIPLLRGETVSMKTDWFELKNARLQMMPYSRPNIHMAVASQVSPTGSRAAGRYGLGLLSIGATSTGGFNALASNWAIAEEMAKDHGQSVSRRDWRLVGLMHIAETREKAIENVKFGLEKWIRYFREVASLPLVPDFAGDPIAAVVDSGLAVVGTPDDAIAQIQRLADQSGGFGGYLHMAHNWADWEQTKKSYELFARYVFPVFQGLNENRIATTEDAIARHHAHVAQARQAVGARIAQHIEEKGGENILPEIFEAMELENPTRKN